MYINSNLSAKEAFNLYGTLPVEMLEKCVDFYDAASDQDLTEFGDVKAGFPDEDFLEPILDLLKNLSGNLKKSATKEALQFIIEQAEDLQLTVASSSEYGMEQLTETIERLEQLEALK
jgi:hypothetical protein